MSVDKPGREDFDAWSPFIERLSEPAEDEDHSEVEVLQVEAEPVAVVEPSADEKVFPLAEAGQYYIGLWSGIPNYKCPFCSYAVLSKKGPEPGDGAVELHILNRIDQGDPRHMKALELKGGLA